MNLQAESPTVQSVPIDTLILHQDKFLVPGPPWPWNLNAIRVDLDSDQTPSVDPPASGSGSTTSLAVYKSEEHESDSLHLAPRNFVWGEKVVRNALPCFEIPPWLDPLDVDIDDPTELPLCWYGVPFLDDMIFEYTERIKLAVYMKRPNLELKVGDLDVYRTWPKFVKWFKDQTGFTMRLQEVWGEPLPILTFFTNHKMARVKDENWELISVTLEEIGYPNECEPKWYLDGRLAY